MRDFFCTVGGKKVTGEELRLAKEPYYLKKCALARFSRRSGKIDTMLEGLGFAVMHAWAYQHTTSSKDTVIWCKETKEVLFYLEGRKDSLPEDYGFKPDNMKIGDLCAGLAES